LDGKALLGAGTAYKLLSCRSHLRAAEQIGLLSEVGYGRKIFMMPLAKTGLLRSMTDLL